LVRNDRSKIIKVNRDREKMAELGLTLDQVGCALQTAFSGADNTKYRAGENEFDNTIKLAEFDGKN